MADWRHTAPAQSDLESSLMAVDLLLSYALNKTTDFAEVKEAQGPEQMLMIDSGAFTAFQTGKPIKLEDYAAFLRHWEGCYDYAITLDVIGDPKATARNLRKLHDMGLPVLPVYTASAPLSELTALAKDHKYICYGGIVKATKHPELQVPAINRVIKEAARHGAKIHTLGQTKREMLHTCRPYSCDSSWVAQSGRYNTTPLFVPDEGRIVKLYFGPRAFEGVTHPRWAKRRSLIKAHGLDIAKCLSGDVIRSREELIVTYRAGCLGIGLFGAFMQQGADRPHIYSAVGGPTQMAGAMQAARAYRDRTLPHPLNNFAVMPAATEW
jgi:hypothetical protein